MKKNRGFTLIELLAVIVILAIIVLIAVPVVMNIINRAQKSAFKDSAYGILKAGELYYTNQLLRTDEITSDKTFLFPNDNAELEIKGSEPTGGTMVVNTKGQISMAITNGKYCVIKGFNDDDVIMNDDLDNCFIPISITDIILIEESITVFKGATKKLEVTIEPSDATNKALSYLSKDESIATIQDGVITGIAEGTTTIILSSTDGSNISEEIEVVVESPIMTSTNSCIEKGNICSDAEIVAGVLVNVKVNDTKNYDFYVINNTENEVTLIMDRNLGTKIKWHKDLTNSQIESNDLGPVTTLTYLNQLTFDWDNIDVIKNYEYVHNLDGTEKAYGYQKIQIENGVGKLTSKDGQTITELPGLCKTRILTRKEIKDLSALNSNSEPAFLYANLYRVDKSFPKGYWTLTPKRTFDRDSNFLGYIGESFSTTAGTSSDYGVRPVITLSK